MDKDYKKAFKECCDKADIKVIDVSDSMIAEYEKSYALSYGFSNSAPGEGHLNEVGHRIVAEAVYKCINETEVLK